MSRPSDIINRAVPEPPEVSFERGCQQQYGNGTFQAVMQETPAGMRRAGDGGIKADLGKPPLSLIDPAFTRSMARVLKMGEDKYGTANWMQGLNYSWLIDSAKRHIQEFEEGKLLDEESGQSPLVNAACCMMMLNWFDRNGLSGREFDDRRFKKVTHNDQPEG